MLLPEYTGYILVSLVLGDRVTGLNRMFALFTVLPDLLDCLCFGRFYARSGCISYTHSRLF